jgi:hypothetical protein
MATFGWSLLQPFLSDGIFFPPRWKGSVHRPETAYLSPWMAAFSKHLRLAHRIRIWIGILSLEGRSYIEAMINKIPNW